MTDLSYLDGLDLAFGVNPVSVDAHGIGDDITVTYRYRVETHPLKKDQPSIYGTLLMVAKRTGLHFDWEELIVDGQRKPTTEQAQYIRDALIRHLAAQLLYHYAWIALLSHDIQANTEGLHA